MKSINNQMATLTFCVQQETEKKAYFHLQQLRLV